MTHSAETIVPIIVEAGSRSKKSIRKLKEGTGKLMQEVSDIVNETRADPATHPAGPIVIVYKEKRPKLKKMGLGMPMIPTPLDLFR